MNVTQMHLAIQQGVDKINSLQADMLLSEEIDIELNKSMSRFLNTKYGKGNKYGKGFEESQKRIDDLRSLVKEYEAPVTYKEQYNNNFWVDYFKLPADYLYLVNQRSELFIDKCKSLSWEFDELDPISYFVLPFNKLYTDQVTNNPVVDTTGTGFITNLSMIADPDDTTLGIADATDLNSVLSNVGAPTYVYPADLQTLKDDLLDPSNWGSGFQWYWETYGQLSFPGSFVIIVDTNQHAWFNWDSTQTNSTSNTNKITQLMGQFNTSADWLDPINPIIYAEYTDDALGAKRIPDPVATREYALNKFIQQDDIAKLLDDPFNTTKYTSPLTTMREDYIDVYTSDIFIIDKVKITYIRKPKQISLSLGVSCELPEHTHQEIVDMTVSSILEGISDPRYKTHQLEVSKNE